MTTPRGITRTRAARLGGDEIVSAAGDLPLPANRVNTRPPWDDPRRASARILDTAQGVLVALHRCILDEAFTDIMHTAKSHNISPFSLADALVGIAQDQPAQDPDDAAVATARQVWGHLLGAHNYNPTRQPPVAGCRGDNDPAPILR